MGDRITDRVPGSAAPAGPDAVINLEKIAHGIAELDAVLVFHVGDGRLYAAWVSSRSGLRAEELAGGLRDAYRACLGASFSFAAPSGHAGRPDAPGLSITIEMHSRTVMIKRSRAFGVACLFDASMPLGMARLVAARITSALEPDLPIVSVGAEALPPALPPAASAPLVSVSTPPPAPTTQNPASAGSSQRALPIAPAAITSPMASSLPVPIATPRTSPMASSFPSPMASSMASPMLASPMASSLPSPMLVRAHEPLSDILHEIPSDFLPDFTPEPAPPAPPADARSSRSSLASLPEADRDLPPRTLDFPSTGVALVQRSISEPGEREASSDADRVRRALDYLREHAPEPHVAALRIALRAGVTPLALERPGSLSSSKVILIEAAIEDILGVDISDLGRLL